MAEKCAKEVSASPWKIKCVTTKPDGRSCSVCVSVEMGDGKTYDKTTQEWWTWYRINRDKEEYVNFWSDLESAYNRFMGTHGKHILIEAPEPTIRDAKEKVGLADRYLDLIRSANVFLFKDNLGETFVDFEIAGHRERQPIKSDFFEKYIRWKIWTSEARSASRDVINQVAETLAAEALFTGKELPLYNRAALLGDELWYDLSNDAWSAVRINSQGWEIVSNPPVIFRREDHMVAQASPVPGTRDDFDELCKLINYPKEDEVFWKSALVEFFVPGFPYPIINPFGEKGAAKTGSAMVIKQMVDPSRVLTHDIYNPRTNINNVLSQNYVAVLDNLSYLDRSNADKLCKAVTGEYAQERELHTNKKNIFYGYMTRMVITSVHQIGTNYPDLAQRTAYSLFPTIEEKDRSEWEMVWKDFKDHLPAALGFIFTTLSKAMPIKKELRLEKHPRMADFAAWGEAISRALYFEEDSFIRAYSGILEENASDVLSSSPLAQAILALVKNNTRYVGPAEPFLRELEGAAAEQQIDIESRAFPQTANSLSTKLANIVVDLRDEHVCWWPKKFYKLDPAEKAALGATEYDRSRTIHFLVKDTDPLWKARVFLHSKIGGIAGSEDERDDSDKEYRYGKPEPPRNERRNDVTMPSASAVKEGKGNAEDIPRGMKSPIEADRLRSIRSRMDGLLSTSKRISGREETDLESAAIFVEDYFGNDREVARAFLKRSIEARHLPLWLSADGKITRLSPPLISEG